MSKEQAQLLDVKDNMKVQGMQEHTSGPPTNDRDLRGPPHQSSAEELPSQYGPPNPKRVRHEIPPQPSYQTVTVNSGNAKVVIHRISNEVAAHPDLSKYSNIYLQKLAFYNIVYTLVIPTALLPCFQPIVHQFNLPPQFAAEIARNCNKQVLLLFSSLDKSVEEEEFLPLHVYVKVNGAVIHPIGNTKRVPVRMNLTSKMNLLAPATNTILIQCIRDYMPRFHVAVYVVEKYTTPQLLRRMHARGIAPAHHTLELIKKMLTGDDDCEMTQPAINISLICPLSQRKIAIPCRGLACTHVKTFDIENYLRLNEVKPTWKCPVCSKLTLFNDIVIDEYFLKVLSSVSNGEETEIKIQIDGTWNTKNSRNESSKVETHALPASSNETLSTGSNTCVIDLTLSDSDDDDSTSAKHCTTAQSSSKRTK